MYLLNKTDSLAKHIPELESTQAGFTALQLLLEALRNKNFATTLLNHAYRIEITLKKFELGLDDVNQDIWERICHTNPINEVPFYIAKNECPWLNERILKALIKPILGLAHLENTLLIWGEETSLEKAGSMSVQALANDFADIFKYASRHMLLNDDEVIAQSNDLQKQIIGSMDYLVEHKLKNKLNSDSFSMVTALQNLLTIIAVDYNETSSDVKRLELDFCDDIKYNTANNHLNNNYTLCEIDFPKTLSTLFTFAESGNGNSINGIVKPNPSKEVMPNLLENAISYTLNTSCDCEHDCCGCVSATYRADHIGNGYLWIRRTTTTNY